MPCRDDLPSYTEALADLPPCWSQLDIPFEQCCHPPPYFSLKSDPNLDNSRTTIDFNSIHHIRSHVSKKKKQEAKKQQQAKWFDSDNEGEKAPAEDEQNGDGAGGGSGGAGGNGDGGNGGGGGDDDDDWNEGGGKKKGKKGKKGKHKNDDEEEEEKEEEKEEDAASPAAKVPGSFWDDNNGDVNPDDEWGTSTGKKKKGKKGKVCYEAHMILLIHIERIPRWKKSPRL